MGESTIVPVDLAVRSVVGWSRVSEKVKHDKHELERVSPSSHPPVRTQVLHNTFSFSRLLGDGLPVDRLPVEISGELYIKVTASKRLP